MTLVVIRKSNNQIVAFFPKEPGNTNSETMTCYAHIGQHHIAHQDCLKESLKVTTPEDRREATKLIRELRNIGYKIAECDICTEFNDKSLEIWETSRNNSLHLWLPE